MRKMRWLYIIGAIFGFNRRSLPVPLLIFNRLYRLIRIRESILWTGDCAIIEQSTRGWLFKLKQAQTLGYEDAANAVAEYCN